MPFPTNASPWWLLLLPLAAQASPALAPATGTLQDDPNAIRILLTANLETTLSSQMSGTLGKLQASLGQPVKQGALLARFDCREGEAQARVAQAELQMARQDLAAKRNLRKLDAVGDLEVAIAATGVQKAEGAHALARARTSYCDVRAPFAGRIAQVQAKPYQTMTAGTPLFDLVSDGPSRSASTSPPGCCPGCNRGRPSRSTCWRRASPTRPGSATSMPGSTPWPRQSSWRPDSTPLIPNWSRA